MVAARRCAGWLLAASAAARAAAGPLIGIYPTDTPKDQGDSYYTAYKEYLAQFGASSIMLPREGNVEEYFHRLNGFFIPGGETLAVQPFVRDFVHRAIQAHKEGDYFPVWGTCLGFQWISESIGGVPILELGQFDSEDLASTIDFTPAAPGRLFASMNETVRHWMTSQDIVYEDHKDGIEPTHFQASAPLRDLFDVLATSVDRKGKRYVAAIEARGVPIYGVQFHPEKVRYVNNTPGDLHNIPKTPEARAASDHFAEFFVQEVRKNKHHTVRTDSEIHL